MANLKRKSMTPDKSVLDKINEEAGKYAHEEYEGSHAAVARSAYKAGRLKSIEENKEDKTKIEKLEKELERVKGWLKILHIVTQIDL